MATADEIIVRLTAENGTFNAGMDEAAAKVKASTDAMSASVAASLSTFRDFDNIQKSSIKTAQDAAAAQATLTAAQASGAYTTEELAAKQAILDAAMAKLPREMGAASAATAAFTSNSRVMGEVSTIVSEAMSGNFGRIRRSAAALANQSGVLSVAMRSLATPAGLAALAIGGIGLAAYEAGQRAEEFQQALERSNGASGLTAAELSGMAERIGGVTEQYREASEAVRMLAADGRFTADQINDIALAMVQYAEGTGQNIQSVFALMQQILEKPAEAADTLHEKMGILSDDQAQQIKQLITSGEKQQAINLELQVFEQHAPKAFEDARKQAGNFSNALDTVEHKIGNIVRGLGEIGERGFSGIDWAFTGNTDAGSEYFNGSGPDDSQAKVDAARKQGQKSSGPDKGTYAAFQQEGDAGVDLTGNLESQLQTLQAAQNTSYTERESAESAYWAYILSRVQEGTSQYITAWQHLQQVDNDLMTKSAQAFDEAERKKQEAAKQSARAREQAARETQQAEDEEARHVKEMMQQESQQIEQASRARAQSAYQTAEDEVDAAKAGYEEQYHAGEISLQELVQLELQAVQKKLNAETDYYSALEKLDAGNVAAEIMDQQAITNAVATAARERSRIVQQEMQEELRIRRQTAQEEAQLVANSVNQMLFSNQTLKQRLASIGQDILSRFIEVEAQKIAEAWASQNAQTAAVVFGYGVRDMAAATSALTTKAIDADTGKSQITTAAAAGAAKAYQAVVGIPYVGPVLAPIAAGVAFAGIEAFAGDIASAAGGWERIPADTIAQVHKDEMVLPAHIAEPMRQMAKRGAGGGDIHNHFHAADPRSFIDMARRRPSDLAKLAKQLGRRGY